MDINVNVSGNICINVSGLEGLGVLLNPATPLETPKKSPVKSNKTAQIKEDAAEIPAVTDKDDAETPITPEQVQAKARQLASAGKQAEVRKTILAFGIQKISDLAPEKCAEALAVLEAIE